MSSDSKLVTLKVILLGDAGTGKTTLAHRYMTGLFKQNKLTLGVQFHIKRIFISLDSNPSVKYNVKLQIWDFAGEKRFRFLLPSYCRGAHGGLFLYDITNKNSLGNVTEWIELIHQNAGNIPLLLVGAKNDLEDHREISREDGITAAKDYNMVGFIETSSKTGYNVESAFETITKLMLKTLVENK
ncbi:MAG: Rab family GTPase [Promethearchaeota archaeon]